ncbi:MAG: DUF1573 domain-containing protein [Mariniblastus sp.]
MLNMNFQANKNCLLVAVVITFLFSQSPMVVGQEWPAEMFESSEHDFGAVMVGGSVEKRFEITNTTEEKLRLKFEVSKGSFNAKLSKRTMDPDESVELICTFNPKVKSQGNKRAVVTVKILGEKDGEHEVTLKGKSSPVIFEPAELNFGDVVQGTEASVTAKMTISNDANLRLSDVQCNYRNVRAKVGKPTVENGVQVYNMNFRLLATAPKGRVKDKLSFVFRRTDKSAKAEKEVERLPFVGKVKKVED